MDSKKQRKGSSSDGQEPSKSADPAEEAPIQKTPVRPGKGVKRKIQTPSSTPSKADDAEKPSSAKKRRRSTSGTPLFRVGSPGSLLKPAMTERQQMALLLQMTDPQKQATIEETPPRVDTPPRSRLQRRNERGETPLHIACIRGDIKTASSLVEQGAAVNATDNAGWTPLHEACNYGHTDIVALLLRNGANVNVRGMDGDTPLHDAAMNGHLEVVRILMDNGGDATSANDKGVTPLDVYKDKEVLRLLKRGEMETEPSAVEEKPEMSASEEEKEQSDLPQAKDRSEKTPAGVPLPSPPMTKTGSSDRDSQNADVRTEQSVAVPLSSSEPTKLHRSSPPTSNKKPLAPKAKGTFYSDISSSESDSDYLESASRRRGKGLPLLLEKRETPLVEVSEAHKGEEVSEELSGEEKGAAKLKVEEGANQQEGEGVETLPESTSVGTSDEMKPPAGPREEREGTTEEEAPVETAGAPSEVKEDIKEKEAEKLLDTAPADTSPSPKAAPPDATSTPPEGSHVQQRPNLEPTSGIETKELPVGEAPPHQPKESEMDTKQQKQETEREADLDLRGDTVTSEPRTSPAKEAPLSFTVSIPLSLVRISSSKLPQGAREPLKTKGRGEQQMRSVPERKPDEPMELELPQDAASKGQRTEPPDKRESQGGEARLLPSEPKSDSRELSKPAKASEKPDSQQDPKATGTSGREASVTTVTIEKHTKHSRKPQYVFSSKKFFKENKKEGDKMQLECGESLDPTTNQDDTVSFSVSLDWGALTAPSKSSTSKSLSSKESAHGRKRDREESGSHRNKPASDLEEDRGSDSDTSKSTIISLPTSLPIIFSSHAGSLQSMQQQGSPPKQQSARDVLTTPPNFKPKTLPILLEAAKLTGSQVKRGTQASTIIGRADMFPQDLEDLSLKRFRLVQRSVVVQQRQEKQGPPPSRPTHFDSFLTRTRDYRSRNSPQPISPKTVYPPVHTSMYKLFTEQESERVRLAAAHLTEQDRLRLSMEQELVRAHQRASKCPASLNACAVLLERLLPRSDMEPAAGDSEGRMVEGSGKEESPTSSLKAALSTPQVDSRLLAGLVQDVWDKFLALKASLLSRQRHEAEALWLGQQSQWAERLTELEPLSPHAFPGTHVPLAPSLGGHLL